MPSSRSGAGGKIVTNRRRNRLAATPYDRPPPRQAPPPPPKNPNWFSGVVPSARAIVSGAGRILSSIFSESGSSSSEDEDSVSEDGVDNDNQYENVYDGVGELDKDSQLTMQRTDPKRLIEELIMHETFSREECNNLIQVLNSRVLEGYTKEREKSALIATSMKAINDEDADTFNQAVQEAKKWFLEKKVGSSSVTEFARGTSNVGLNALEPVESGGGSPVDVARSYMKGRPPWASPTRNFELGTPLTSTMKLFNEGTLHSAGTDSLSLSKKRSSLASGSWNIQEELRRVRAKATDDMLRTPSSKINPSSFSIPQSKVAPTLGEQMTEPESVEINELVDAGVSYDPTPEALGSRQDDKVIEPLPSRPAASVSGNSEDPNAVQADSECAASKFLDPLTSNHTEEHQADSHLTKANGAPTSEATESAAKQTANGLSSPSVPAGLHTVQNDDNHNIEENHNTVDTANESKSVGTNQVAVNCELLSEAYMEVPIAAETDEELPPDLPQKSPKTTETDEELPPYLPQKSPKTKANNKAGKLPLRTSGRFYQKKLRKR